MLSSSSFLGTPTSRELWGAIFNEKTVLNSLYSQQISKSANQQISKSANQQISKSANQQISKSANQQ
ncbi:hypothetical protein ACW5WQ_03620, partial [Aeromonas rivuli]